MKFVSKCTNLRVVLRPGIPGSAITGREPISGIYVKFQDGVAIVNQEDHIEMLLKHPAFERDFIAVDEIQKDPFAYRRSEIEPGHIIQEIKYGHVEGTKSSIKAPPLTPQMNKLIDDLAAARVKEMLPGIIEATIRKMAAINKEKKEEAKEEVESIGGDSTNDVDVDKVLGVQPEAVEANEAFTPDIPSTERKGRGRPKKIVE